MPDDTNVRLGDPEKAARFRGCPLVVERHHDDGAFALGEGLNAAGELTVVEPGHRRRIRHEIASEPLQQLFLASRALLQIENGHAARAQDELGESVQFPQASRPERAEDLHEHLLHEVVGGRRRSQVAQAIEPDSRAHAAAHFGFRFAIAVSDPRREVGVAQPDIHRAPF